MKKKPDESIIQEILKYKISELTEGRTPIVISLSESQKIRLKEWMDSTQTHVLTPDGHIKTSPGVRFEEGIIFGMKFDREICS